MDKFTTGLIALLTAVVAIALLGARKRDAPKPAPNPSIDPKMVIGSPFHGDDAMIRRPQFRGDDGIVRRPENTMGKEPTRDEV